MNLGFKKIKNSYNYKINGIYLIQIGISKLLGRYVGLYTLKGSSDSFLRFKRLAYNNGSSGANPMNDYYMHSYRQHLFLITRVPKTDLPLYIGWHLYPEFERMIPYGRTQISRLARSKMFCKGTPVHLTVF